MPNTYVALRTETVAVATNSVTINLSGISGYTDLVLVINAGSSAGADANFRLNGDSGSNYSRTLITGNGSTATSSRTANALVGRLNANAYPNGGAGDTTIIAHFMNYANTTTFKTVISRANNAGLGSDAVVNLWRNTAAITSIEILSTSAATYAVGSTFSLYGIANADQGAAKATGGIITEDSQYWYHTFGASGAFIPKQSLTCDVLVVAGGGGGGGTIGENAGGGGAGGFRTATGQSLTATTYNVTVGGGGAGATSNVRGTTGSNSVFSTITSNGGGGGGAYGLSGLSGGSGGGGGQSDGIAGSTVGGAGNTPSTSPSQGSNGGTTANFNYSGSGGGGATAVGTNSSGTNGRDAGAGGAGTASSYSGFSVTYAGGGAGGQHASSTASVPLGGAGGGGNGGFKTTPPTAGTTNTGGGGGGGGDTAGSRTGAAGGSGVVIIRYSKV